MRNQPLTGYLLHHKPYKETRALYHFFSQSHGVVHGVGKKGMPLFSPIQLFATGKRKLKTFSQIQPSSQPCFYTAPINADCDNHQSSSTQTAQSPQASKQQQAQQQCQCQQKPQQQPQGQNLYAGFYLNEILSKLLDIEEPLAKLWQTYQQSLHCLQHSLNDAELRLILRQFERVLFAELGCSISHDVDSDGDIIHEHQSYRFIPEEGFVRLSDATNSPDSPSKAPPYSLPYSPNRHPTTTIGQELLFTGICIQNMASHQSINQLDLSHHSVAPTPLEAETPTNQHTTDLSILKDISRLHRHIIDHLLDYQPLNSRKLWKDYHRYSVH